MIEQKESKEYALLKATYGCMKLMSRRFKQIKIHKDSFTIVLLAWTMMGFVKIWIYKSSAHTSIIYVKTFVDLAGVVSMWYVDSRTWNTRNKKAVIGFVFSTSLLSSPTLSLSPSISLHLYSFTTPS